MLAFWNRHGYLAKGLGRLYLLPLLAFIGCSGPDRASLSGQIKIQEQTIENGAIRLFPMTDTPGKGASTTIKGGRYTFPRSAGLFSGSYHVSITGWPDGTPSNVEQSSPGTGAATSNVEIIDRASLNTQYVPPEFNMQTTLSINLKPNANEKDWGL